MNIRFKEFSDLPRIYKLSDLVSIHARIGWQNLRTSEFLDSGNYMLITGTDFNNGKINYDTCHYIEKERYDQDKNIQLKNGNILITKDGTLGKVAIVENLRMPATLNAGVFNVVVKNDQLVDNIYLYHYLKGPFLMDYVSKRATGGTIKHLNQNILVDFPVKIPSLIEQKKVSKLFSLLDKKIELQTKKIEDLKLFKLYIRNNLSISSKGKEIKLKDLVYCDSSNITLSDIENDDGIYPIYGATGLIKNISRYNISKEYIAIVKDGAGVGRAIICNENSSILATMNALIPKCNYPINYICELINTIKFNKYIVGSGIPHIYFKDYGNEEFQIHDIKTAEKISHVFNCIDKKINLLSTQVDKLNQLKKGLMQNMFV